MKKACPILVLLLGLLTPVRAVSEVEKSADPTPNIVFILADDLGYGDVQCLNPERGKIATPNLDRLAAQGIIFTNAHSTSSVCTPTRYSVLTGRYNWRSRLQEKVLYPGDSPLIPTDRLTVAKLFKERGYATAAVGKVLINCASLGPPDFSHWDTRTAVSRTLRWPIRSRCRGWSQAG